MMQRPDDEDKDARYSYVKEPPLYSSNVLVGNWLQKRYENQPQSTTAIVPCVNVGENQTDDKCEQHLTTQREDYVSDEVDSDLCRDFIEAGALKYRNFWNFRTSTVELFDAEKYRNNYSTMNTLVYNLWPKMLKKKLKRAAQEGVHQHHPPTWRPDPLESFGNNSVIKRKINNQFVCPVAKTYDSDFIPRPINPPKSARRSDMIDRLT